MAFERIVEKCGKLVHSSLLEEVDQFVHGHLSVAQYGTQQAGTKRFAGMNGDSGGSAVRMFEKDMTTARPIDNKAAFF